ncbi:MAG: carbohydrate kinase [Clostridiales bacterium]
MFDITAIGEVLIDFLSLERSDNNKLFFEGNPGGAPANVMACISKFGGKTNFIGKVGNDIFGEYLKKFLKDKKINVESLSISNDVNTTLAFVKLDNSGDRKFSFYRNPGADTQLSVDDINFNSILNSKIIHFGSLSLTNEPSKTTTIEVLKYSKKKNKIISFDPNYRDSLWSGEKQAVDMIKNGMYYADIVKMSEEELFLLTNENNIEKGIRLIKNNFDLNIILITLGSKGCYYCFKNFIGKVNPVNAQTIDTTGAGDIFFGSFLYYLINKLNVDIVNLTKENIYNMVLFANTAAAVSTEKKGAISSIPELEDVCKRIQ